MQEAGEFCTLCEIFAHVRNFAHSRNFRACTKIRALREIFLLCKILCFLFSTQNDSVLLIFLFALDVILLTWVFLVFHFIARLYIAILCTVDLTDGGIEEHTGALFLFSTISLSLSLFLSFSLTFSATKHSLENDNSRNARLNPLILEKEGY